MLTAELTSGERARIEKLVPRFLMPMLKREWSILSVGCGAGHDVLTLRAHGFEAWGLDPSRLVLDAIPAAQRPCFKVATVEDQPFGDRTFDFVYALDVIEHVGCRDFGTILSADAYEARVQFKASCIRAMRPGGTLLLTTSNKLCPIDVGHWHKYHWFGNLARARRKFGISIPWSKSNFLLSFGDVKRLFADAVGPDAVELTIVPTACYPSVSARGDMVSRLINAYLRLADRPLLIGTPFSPILIVSAKKLK